MSENKKAKRSLSREYTDGIISVPNHFADWQIERLSIKWIHSSPPCMLLPIPTVTGSDDKE